MYVYVYVVYSNLKLVIEFNKLSYFTNTNVYCNHYIYNIFSIVFVSLYSKFLSLANSTRLFLFYKLLLLSKKILEIISANRQSLINIWEVQVFLDWDWCKKFL